MTVICHSGQTNFCFGPAGPGWERSCPIPSLSDDSLLVEAQRLYPTLVPSGVSLRAARRFSIEMLRQFCRVPPQSSVFRGVHFFSPENSISFNEAPRPSFQQFSEVPRAPFVWQNTELERGRFARVSKNVRIFQKWRLFVIALAHANISRCFWSVL